MLTRAHTFTHSTGIRPSRSVSFVLALAASVAICLSTVSIGSAATPSARVPSSSIRPGQLDGIKAPKALQPFSKRAVGADTGVVRAAHAPTLQLPRSKAPAVLPPRLRAHGVGRSHRSKRARARLAAWVAGGLVYADASCNLATLYPKQPIIRTTTGTDQTVAFRTNIFLSGASVASNSSDWIFATAASWGSFR